MSIRRIKDLPEGSGSLTTDDIFLFMDDPTGSAVTKKISLSEISSVIGGGGGGNPFDQNLNTTDFPTFSGVNLTNGSSLAEGSYDSGIGGNGGISLNCAIGYELNWQAGHLRNIAIGDNTGTPQTIYCDSPINLQQTVETSNTLLLLHLDDSFVDSSVNNLSVTPNGDVQLNTTEKQFGSASAYFDGDGDSITISNIPDFDMAGQSFCFEAWVNPASDAEYSIFNRCSGEGEVGFSIQRLSGGNILFSFGDSWNAGGNLAVGQWSHLACTYDGTTRRCFINGDLVGSNSSGLWSNVDTDLTIGDRPSDSRHFYFEGYIDEVRVVRGDAVFTSNFTPSTSAYTVDMSTTTSQLIVNGTGITFPDGSVQTTAGGGTVVVSLVFDTILNTDASSGDIFDVTLTDNITLANPTNPVDGKTLRWRITQDNSGNRTVTLGDKFVIPSSASSPLPWSTTGDKMDVLAATYHAGRDKWDIVAFVPGY